jgi:hypothetical protein
MDKKVKNEQRDTRNPEDTVGSRDKVKTNAEEANNGDKEVKDEDMAGG